MFDPNFLWFYLCFVPVPQIAWSARVNTTALDGKVIISGNHNEVVVSTDRDNEIALAKIKRDWSHLRNRTKSSSLGFRASLRGCRLWKVKVSGQCFRVMLFCLNRFYNRMIFSPFFFSQF